MLTAAIIYIQGSGGNLLARSLALSEQTIPFLPKQFANTQPLAVLSEKKRLLYYNNWDYKNWIQSETEIDLWYHTGLTDFVDYELSPYNLIDRFHPAQFKYDTDKKLLWTDITNWKNLIFIDYQEEDLKTIVAYASLKRKDLQHKLQIEMAEISALNNLLAQFGSDNIVIRWKDMLQLETYLNVVGTIANKLNITLNLELVKNLWIKWYKHNQLLLGHIE